MRCSLTFPIGAREFLAIEPASVDRTGVTVECDAEFFDGEYIVRSELFLEGSPYFGNSWIITESSLHTAAPEPPQRP
jgi:hypothetical protein